MWSYLSCFVKTLFLQTLLFSLCSFSNVALKINTKLFSRTSEACAWNVSKGLEWVKEQHTMVMGYSMSHGTGQLWWMFSGDVCSI